MKKIKLFHTVAMAAFLAAVTSCEHKDLCYEHPHPAEIKVVFDWHKAPGAIPESMCAYLLPVSGEEPLRYDFANRTGGTIRSRQGDYRAFCLNGDAEGVFFREEGSFELTTGNATVVSGFMSLGDESAAGTGHGGGACRPTARHALVRPLRGGHPPHGAGQYHRLLSRAVGLHLHGGDPQRQKPEIRHGAERHALGSGRGTPRGAERGQWGTGHGALPSAIP